MLLTEIHSMETERNTAADLLVRYWGLGKGLAHEEIETLLAALEKENQALGGRLQWASRGEALLEAMDEENKFLHGSIHELGLKRLAERGIY